MRGIEQVDESILNPSGGDLDTWDIEHKKKKIPYKHKHVSIIINQHDDLTVKNEQICIRYSLSINMTIIYKR